MNNYLLVFMVALFISYILTPEIKKLAIKIGAVDVPKDNRRMHKEPMPRLGGLAIYISFMVTVLIAVDINTKILSILVGATIIVILGIIDDIKAIGAKWKLLGQLLAALVVIYGGVSIDFLRFPIGDREIIGLGILYIPVTIFWIIGITNTLNLIDGLDGLSAGVGLISSISLFSIAVIQGRYDVALILIILAGATLGFLRYNFNPAKIFMGDTGSLLLGFLLGTLSIEGVMKSVTTIAVILPVLVLGIPIFDTAFAIVRRIINKRSIAEADKGHLHHRLFNMGYTQRQTVLILYAISVILGGSAVLLSGGSNYVIIFIFAAICLLASVMILRYIRKNKNNEEFAYKKRR